MSRQTVSDAESKTCRIAGNKKNVINRKCSVFSWIPYLFHSYGKILRYFRLVLMHSSEILSILPH